MPSYMPRCWSFLSVLYGWVNYSVMCLGTFHLCRTCMFSTIKNQITWSDWFYCLLVFSIGVGLFSVSATGGAYSVFSVSFLSARPCTPGLGRGPNIGSLDLRLFHSFRVLSGDFCRVVLVAISGNKTYRVLLCISLTRFNALLLRYPLRSPFWVEAVPVLE